MAYQLIFFTQSCEPEKKNVAQSAGAVEYTDCMSAER